MRAVLCQYRGRSQSIVESGPGSKLAKIDIKNGYRIVPVHPEDRLLLGMVWDKGLYVDAVLPFGLRSAPKGVYSISRRSGMGHKKRRGTETIPLPR